MSNPKPTQDPPAYWLLALDAGAGAIKLAGQSGSIELPAQISSDERAGISMALAGVKTKKAPMRITAKGRSYYVGLYAHDFGPEIENMTFEKLTGTPDMQAEVYGAFTQYQLAYGFFGDVPLRLLIGLPNQMLSEGDEKSKKLKATICSWLIGDHAWRVDGVDYTATVESVSLTSQSVGAYYDWFLNDKGGVVQRGNGRSSAANEETLILSIGWNTAEAAMIRGNTLVPQYTKGKKVGARRLAEIFMASQGNNFYTRGELDAIIRDGGVSMMKEAIPLWWGEVNDFITEVWRDRHKRVSRIILVGGGSILLSDYLRVKFEDSNVHIPSNPVKSISHGLFKLLLNQDKKKPT